MLLIPESSLREHTLPGLPEGHLCFDCFPFEFQIPEKEQARPGGELEKPSADNNNTFLPNYQLPASPLTNDSCKADMLTRRF